MSQSDVQTVLEIVRRLPPRDRVALADEVDRLAWRDRVQAVLDDLAEARRRGGAPDDARLQADIDATIAEVRVEKSLYERYWTRRPS